MPEETKYDLSIVQDARLVKNIYGEIQLLFL
jgi:hypothetical protein